MLEIGLTKFKPIKFSKMVSVILEKRIHSFYKKTDSASVAQFPERRLQKPFPDFSLVLLPRVRSYASS